jgi:hypothetical protein
VKDALKLFAVQVLLYSIVVFSWRAVATANIAVSVITDYGYALLGFVAVQKIADSDRSSWLAKHAYAAGSALGTWIGIVVSLRVLGK